MVNASYIVGALIKVCIFLKKSVPSEGHLFQHIQLYSQTAFTQFVNMCLHLHLRQAGEREEWGRAIDFFDQLLNVTLIYVLPYRETTIPLCPTLR